MNHMQVCLYIVDTNICKYEKSVGFQCIQIVNKLTKFMHDPNTFFPVMFTTITKV